MIGGERYVKGAGPSRGPRARMCYICGRQTLLAGFDHHVRQCADLFEKREALKPPKERRAVPQDPLLAYGPMNGAGSGMGGEYTHRELEDINRLSETAYQQSLAQCEFCGRKFLPEKLVIHNRSCTASNPAKGVPSAASSGTPTRPTLPGYSSSRNSKGDRDGSAYASSYAARDSDPYESTRLPAISMAAGGAPDQRVGLRNGLRGDAGGNNGTASSSYRETATPPVAMKQQQQQQQRGSGMALPPSEPRQPTGARTMPPRGQAGGSGRNFTSGNGIGTSAAAYPPMEAEYVVPAMLITCPDCGRHFNEVSYEKHHRVCRKVFESKRKPFDSAKARMQGTEMESFNRRGRKGKAATGSTTADLRKGATMSSFAPNGNTGYSSSSSTSAAAAASGGGSDWRKQSQAFRAAIRAARNVSMAEKKSKETGIPLHKLLPQQPAPRDDAAYADYVTCPTCGRRFNQNAGARHIPKCKDIVNKPSFLSRGSGHSATSSYR